MDGMLVKIFQMLLFSNTEISILKTCIDFIENKNWSRILIIIKNSAMELWSALLYKSEFLFLVLSSDLDVINLVTANQAKRAILGFHIKLFL